MKMKTQQPKTYGHCKSSAKGKVHSNTGLPQETKTLNNTIDQLDLIDIYRTFHPKTMNFTFFLKRTWNLLQDRSHPGP